MKKTILASVLTLGAALGPASSPALDLGTVPDHPHWVVTEYGADARIRTKGLGDFFDP